MKKIISLFLAVIISTLIVYPCGPYFDPEDDYYSIFNQYGISDTTMYPFLFNSHSEYSLGSFGFNDNWGRISKGGWEGKDRSRNRWPSKDENIMSWVDYLETLGVKADYEDVLEVVYKVKGDTLQMVKDKTLPRRHPLWKNSFIKTWKKGSMKGVTTYLLYAKQCEGNSGMNYYDWGVGNGSASDDEKIQLIEIGTKLHKDETDIWLKMRYAYQLVRAARYLGDYKLSLEYFEQHLEALNNKNYIYYRAMEQVAGAMFEQKDKSAPYFFAKAFEGTYERRDVCLRGFMISVGDDWEESYALCKTGDEQAVFYTLRALQSWGLPVEEMENIHKVAPQSPYLELLLARQLNKLDRIVFPVWQLKRKYPAKLVGTREYWDDLAGWTSESADYEKEVVRLGALCNKITADATEDKKGFWQGAEATVALLLHDYEASQQLAALVDESSPYYEQAATTGFLARLCALKKVDAAVEEEIAAEYLSKEFLREHRDLTNLMRDIFFINYHRQHEIGKAFICHANFSELQRRLNLSVIDEVEALLRKENKTAFEKLLIDDLGCENPDDLIEMRATYYFQRNQLYKALAEYKKLPADYESKAYQHSYINPSLFSEALAESNFRGELSFKDTVVLTYGNQIEKVKSQTVSLLTEDYPELAFLKEVSNKKELVKAMLDLQVLAGAADMEKGAYYHYLLGCVWTNLGVHGLHRPILYYHTNNLGGEWASWSPQEGPVNFKKYNSPWSYDYYDHYFFDPHIPMEHFNRTLVLADNAELKAKACFMGAKSERMLPDLNYNIPSWDWQTQAYAYSANDPRGNLPFFDELKDKFSDTDYYKEAIRECGYFRAYVEN